MEGGNVVRKVSSVQLRDDLLSMLVAGHETTGSVLTWTVYLLSKVCFCSRIIKLLGITGGHYIGRK
jgi:hypothetical protein